MPTGAKLVAAIGFAGLAFLISSMVINVLPPGAKTTWLWPVNVALSGICGWKILGSRAMGSFRLAIGSGLTASAASALLCIFGHSIGQMVKLSLRKTYSSATEATVAVFEISFEWIQVLSTPELLLTLFIGGMFVAVLAWKAGKVWA